MRPSRKVAHEVAAIAHLHRNHITVRRTTRTIAVSLSSNGTMNNSFSCANRGNNLTAIKCKTSKSKTARIARGPLEYTMRTNLSREWAARSLSLFLLNFSVTTRNGQGSVLSGWGSLLASLVEKPCGVRKAIW